MYARVHDLTVSADYYAAMARIETCLNLMVGTDDSSASLYVDLFARVRLLELVNRLAEPHLGLEMRLDLVEQMQCLLNGKTLKPAVVPVG